MSWVRWGSFCGLQGRYVREFSRLIEDPVLRAEQERKAKQNEDCKDCPGSDLYIYESSFGIVCCGCKFTQGKDDFVTDEDGMLAHIQEHAKAGHHTFQYLMHPGDE